MGVALAGAAASSAASSAMGASAGTAAVQGGMGIITTFLSNRLARQREAAARAENYRYGELAADNAMRRTEELYNKYDSPSALLAQYKEAGLSPSMMFGGGGTGQGGTLPTGAQGTGAAGVSPTSYGIPPIDFAQINLMNAQAEKIKAEKETITGENERGKAELDKLYKEINNVSLQNAYQESQNIITEISAKIAKVTEGTEIKLKQWELNKLEEETELLFENVKQAQMQNEITEDTMNDTIKLVSEQLRNLQKDTLLKITQNKLTNEQISQIINTTKLQTGELKLKAETAKAEILNMIKQNGYKETEFLFRGIEDGINAFFKFQEIGMKVAQMAGM